MQKLTFELVSANNITTFNQLVNEHLAAGWKFMANQEKVSVTPLSSGAQYSISMLMEEEL